MKTKREEALAKSKITRAENERDLFEIEGYKVSVDKRQYIVNNKTYYAYFKTLSMALRDINEQIKKKTLPSGVLLEELADKIKELDNQFLEKADRITKAL